MTFETAEELLGQPERWERLDEAELVQLVSVGSWLAALKDDEALEAGFESLYAYAVENLDAGTRRQVVADLGELLEAFGREHGTCPVNVLRHWLLSDPDFGVVSTAALVAAQVMPPADEDPLTGPKLVLGLALEATDAARQGAIVTGLATLGEAEILALIAAAWDGLDGDAMSDILLRLGHDRPTLAIIDFLVSRLEWAAGTGEEGPIGHVVSSLVRLRRTADGITIGGVTGVPEIDRLFPSWGGDADESPIVVRQVHAPDAVGERIAERLQHAAAAEMYPRLVPLAMRAWGVEDAAFVEGVRQMEALSRVAVNSLHAGAPAQRRGAPRRARKATPVASALGRAPGGAVHGQDPPPALQIARAGRLLDVPVPVEPMPDWDRDDAVLTWGILNPFGPTKVQICRVGVSDDTDALVYTLHNPIAPVCLLLGTVGTGDTASTARLLLDLADRFELGAHVLLKGLPHWVVAPADSGLDVAAFFRTAHAAALERDLAIDDDLEELIASLHRLRLDAQQEVRRQLREGMETFGSGGDTPTRGVARVAAPAAAYERWLKAASDAGHVAAVSTHFLDCWNAALRFQRDAHGV